MEKKTAFWVAILVLVLVLVIIGLIGACSYGYSLGRKQVRTESGIAGALCNLAKSNMIDSANFYVSGKVLEVSETALTVEKDGNKIIIPVSKDTIFNRIVAKEVKEGEPSPPEVIEAKDLKVGENVSLTGIVTPEGKIQTMGVMVIPLPTAPLPLEKSPLPEEKK